MLMPFAMVVEPVLEMEKSVEVAETVDEPIAKRVVAVSPLLVCIANLEKGLEVPMPKEPEVGSAKAVEVAGTVPYIRLPMLSWLLAVADGKKVLLPMPMFP